MYIWVAPVNTPIWHANLNHLQSSSARRGLYTSLVSIRIEGRLFDVITSTIQLKKHAVNRAILETIRVPFDASRPNLSDLITPHHS